MRTLCMLIVVGLIVSPTSIAQEDEGNVWEQAIQKFEEQDAESPPPKDAMLFVGSSSIRMWDLDASFPELQTINRGFGGSQISDSIYFFDRIVKKYAPRAIVFYAGDNDIAQGMTPEEVTKDFETFAKMVEEEIPDTPLIFIAIKPSIARWDKVEAMREANALIKAYIDEHDPLYYADVDAPMIGEDGKPREELFIRDGLHLNKDGYALWKAIVEPIIERAISETATP